MRTLIDKINKFEEGLETIENFNKIFDFCPINELDSDMIVTIGEPCTPETTRLLTVETDGATIEFRHSFKPSVPDIELTDDDFIGYTGEWKARKEAGLPFWKDKNGNYVEVKKEKHVRNETNKVMTQREMSLKPAHYYMLQFLRGCEKSVNRAEISEKLNICRRTVTNYINEMVSENIITIENNLIVLKGEWK